MLAASAAVRSTPPATTRPRVGSSSPASKRRSFDFPLPETPTSAVTAPPGITASTSSSASTTPASTTYRLLTPSTSTAASGNAQRLSHLAASRGRSRGATDERGDEHENRERRGEQRPGDDEGGGRGVLRQRIDVSDERSRPDERGRGSREGGEPDERGRFDGNGQRLESLAEAHPAQKGGDHPLHAGARVEVEEQRCQRHERRGEGDDADEAVGAAGGRQLGARQEVVDGRDERGLEVGPREEPRDPRRVALGPDEGVRIDERVADDPGGTLGAAKPIGR